jgi:hypothetical protein
MKAQSAHNKIVKISQTRNIVIAMDISLTYKYKSNNNYFFDRDFKCYNVVTEKEVPLRKQGGSLGFNINRKFIPLSKIKTPSGSPTDNLEKIATRRLAPKITKEGIIQAICERFEVSEAQMYGRSIKGDLGNARKIWAMLLDKYISNNNTIVANLMGRKSASSTFELIDEGEALRGSNKAFENAYNIIESVLLKETN